MKIAFNRGTKSISSQSGKQMGPGCLIIFGLIFVVAGSAVTYFLAMVPLYKWQASQSWTAAPCTIAQSRVDSQQSDDGTTYKAIVTFEYTFQERFYSGGSYDFTSGYSSGHSGKQAIVSRYPVGMETTCYVNPKDPDQAVLSREFSWGYLIGLFGLIFIIAGLAVMFGGLRSNSKKGSISARGKRQHLPERDYATGSATLKAKSSPLKKFLGILIFALIWNSIVGVIFFAMLKDFSGSGAWFPLIFISIFLLVGVALIAFVIYQFLAMFNPRPKITLSESTIPLGGQVDMTWTFEGSVHRMNGLNIWVQGREEATYQQGTNTRTDRSVFEKIPILETRHTGDMATGRVQFSIPEFTMHSFEADNNKIIWSLHVHGDIPKWPDVQEEFPIIVVPLEQ